MNHEGYASRTGWKVVSLFGLGHLLLAACVTPGEGGEEPGGLAAGSDGGPGHEGDGGPTVPQDGGPGGLPQVTFAQGTLVWVGFSNTYQAVAGYNALPGTAGAFINPHYQTGGGSLYRWFSNERGHREIFLQHWQEGWPVWWHLAARTGEGGMSNYQEQLDGVAEWLLSTVGDAPIWVSILHDYGTDVWPGDGWPDHVIPKAEHEALRDYAISRYGLRLGPVDMGPLTAAQVRDDNVHPNGAGQAFLGGQLRDFFDPMVSP